jgi:hypothetical protein
VKLIRACCGVKGSGLGPTGGGVFGTAPNFLLARRRSFLFVSNSPPEATQVGGGVAFCSGDAVSAGARERLLDQEQPPAPLKKERGSLVPALAHDCTGPAASDVRGRPRRGGGGASPRCLGSFCPRNNYCRWWSGSLCPRSGQFFHRRGTFGPCGVCCRCCRLTLRLTSGDAPSLRWATAHNHP